MIIATNKISLLKNTKAGNQRYLAAKTNIIKPPIAPHQRSFLVFTFLLVSNDLILETRTSFLSLILTEIPLESA